MSAQSTVEQLLNIDSDQAFAEMLQTAAARRDAAWGATVTFSPKVFLPTTNLCRNFCDYCAFRRSPGDAGEWTMAPDETFDWLKTSADQHCIEALFCLGDTPESTFRTYRDLLAHWGFESTVDYLDWAAREALQLGLLPHTNAGILSRDAMQRLRTSNVSLGLMLENISPRLREKGQVHYRARDKEPGVRLKMLLEAGELQIPFTTGLLIGIGETRRERLETLMVIADLHDRFGHIQEVIVQNFRAHESTPLYQAEEPDDRDIAWTVAAARLLLPDSISVQAPPNLNPGACELLLAAGINDFGGISPVTPDYINLDHPWPVLQELRSICSAQALDLQPRLPVYPHYLDTTWLDDNLIEPCHRTAQRLENWWQRATETESATQKTGAAA